MLLGKEKDMAFDPEAFRREHSVEVQLPFIQRVYEKNKKPRIVPVVFGDCSYEVCEKFTALLLQAMKKYPDTLIVVSSDMYHGYDSKEASIIDKRTLDCLETIDPERLYNGLKEGEFQLCGGLPVVTALILAKEKGFNKAVLLEYTNSAIVTANKAPDNWTVGYCSILMEKGEGMLTSEQKIKLLKIARNSIQVYLQTGQKQDVSDDDAALNVPCGAFVTLHSKGQLRGCIGNLTGTTPLCRTVSAMAVSAATDDWRFSPVKLDELNELELEISVLSPLRKIKSTDEIEMGKHGVMVSKGRHSGVFLPQVAIETGWSKEEFLENLCRQKAGIDPLEINDKDTDIYVFTADVFSEKEMIK
jgi:hypothetical protein